MLAGTAWLAVVFSAHAGSVVTDHVVSRTSQNQARVPVTFGQIFKAGDVPRGATLSATLDGRPVPVQVNAKATYPDGSLRHAVVTVRVPSLPGKSVLPLTLATGQAGHSGAAAVTLAQLLATRYDAKVTLDMSGTTYTVHARALLQAAEKAGHCKAWSRHCNLWLSGPLTSAWVVHGAVKSADGEAYPHLRVYFAVRAYAGDASGSVSRVRTDIIVENSNAFAPQAQPQYSARLASGTAHYTSAALTQYAYTRWHRVLWWNQDRPQVYLQQDTRYIQASKAVSRYLPLTPDKHFLDGLRQSCAPLQHCDQTRSMSNTGAQEGIGPLPRWTSVYIVDPDVHAYHWMLANTDALGTYGIHYRDPATGWPVSIREHPNVTIAAWSDANRVAGHHDAEGASYRRDLLPNCVDNAVVTKCTKAWYGTGNPYRWNNAHQPAESYVPYMVTGDYYYMSELAFGASLNELWANPGYRDHAKGLIDRPHGSMRAKAWTLRNMAEAAYLLPDHYPLKAEFHADVENSLEDWNRKYSHNPRANPVRVMTDSVVYDVHGGKDNGVAPWQHNFLTWAAGHVAELGFRKAVPFRNWLAQFEIGLMTDWKSSPARGYCWLEASAYKIQVKDAAGNWLPSYAAVYAATFPTLVGLTCNSPAMVARMGKLEKKSWQAGKMSGYPYSATGFPANFQIGVAAAADSGLPNAREAWKIFQSRSVKPHSAHAYNNYPNFAVMPRFVPGKPTR